MAKVVFEGFIEVSRAVVPNQPDKGHSTVHH
jgi:hypothetical protein